MQIRIHFFLIFKDKTKRYLHILWDLSLLERVCHRGHKARHEHSKYHGNQVAQGRIFLDHRQKHFGTLTEPIIVLMALHRRSRRRRRRSDRSKLEQDLGDKCADLLPDGPGGLVEREEVARDDDQDHEQRRGRA